MAGTYPTYAFKVNGINNPPSALTLTTEIAISTYNGSSLLDKSTGCPISYQPNPLASTAAVLSVSDPSVGAYSAYTVKLIVENEVPADGNLVLTFPKWDDVSLGALVVNSMVTASIVTKCEIASNSPSCSVEPDFTTSGLDKVIVKNAFTSTGKVSPGTEISVTVRNVRNPPTLQPRSTFGISTADGASNLIDSVSGLTLTLTSIGTFTGTTASYTELQGDTGMGQKGTY